MNAEMKNAPLLAGWTIAAGVGAVAFGVALVIGGLGATASVAAGAVLCLMVGLILGLPRADAAQVATNDAVAVSPAASPAPSVASQEPPAPFVSQQAPTMAHPAAGGRRPEAMSGARGGTADDLKLIEGIGPKLEQLCNSLGFYHFDQIARWTADEVEWVDANLTGFKGRVTRDKWVAQARLIVEVGVEEFLRRAKTNDY
jgi:predicted flap endonuclease-1-like 5' DNA nuclease